MIRSIRTTACLLVASLAAVAGWVWWQAPHTSAKPTRQLAATYNTGVGMLDLYLMDDYRGFERLVDVDPRLVGVGGGAARSVAIDQRFPLERRVAAARLLAERDALDGSFADQLVVAVREHDEAPAFCAIQSELDMRLGCVG